MPSLKAQVPACATNVSPANASTNVSPTPYITLKWNPVPGAVLYNVYLDAKLPPTTLVGTVLTDSLNFYNADYSTIYYWYVVPVNGSGPAIGCGANTTTFITSPPPPAPFNDDCIGATRSLPPRKPELPLALLKANLQIHVAVLQVLLMMMFGTSLLHSQLELF